MRAGHNAVEERSETFSLEAISRIVEAYEMIWTETRSLTASVTH